MCVFSYFPFFLHERKATAYVFLHFIHIIWGALMLQNRPVGGANDILLPKGPLLFLWGFPPHLLVSLCPPPEESRLSMPEISEKEKNYLFKSYTDLE